MDNQIMDRKLKQNSKQGFSLLNKTKLLCITQKNKNPYQNINHEYQSIFVHIPKNAGVSIETVLFNEKVGHKKLIAFKAHDKNKFFKYFKFSFVRHPWDRLVSAFYFLKQGGRNSTDRAWSQEHLSLIPTFEDFVLRLESNRFARQIMKWQHFRPQISYITDENNHIALDYMGRVENLEKDLRAIATKLNLSSFEVPHINKSSKSENDRNYVRDCRLNKIVEKRYKEDFERLGY